MDRQIDKKIKIKFLEDTYISESTKNKINEVLEQNRNINIKFENKRIIVRRWLSILATILIIFLGSNVYAYTKGKPNIFSLIADVLHINSEEYEKEKKKAEISKVTENDNILILKDYAYNKDILIVNYLYKTSNNNYNDIILQEDLEEICLIENTDEGTEYPIYEVAHLTIKQAENEYYICKVYDMNNMKKENGKINIVINEISNQVDEMFETIEKDCNIKFSIDVSENKKIAQEYKISSNTIDLDLNELRQKKEIETLGIEQIQISKVINTNFFGLIYLYSDTELSIFNGIVEEGCEEYITAKYSFEISDENGNIINNRKSQQLTLSLDEKQQILIVNSLNQSKVLNIKVYEDNTNILLSNCYIQLN